jgi:hypothetical protein
MRVKCKNCLPKEGIEVPHFDQLEKNKIVSLKIESPLRSTKHLLEQLNLSHRDAKYIVTHLNTPYGHCNRCNFEQLDKEYITCPKCKALNFNWKAS